MDYDARMRKILWEDALRRQAREKAEMPTDYAHSRNLTGEPSEHNRQYRASDDCWNRGLAKTRTVGTADGRTRSVKITKAGKTEIVPTRGFRSRRNVSRAATGNLRQTRVMANDPRFGNKA